MTISTRERFRDNPITIALTCFTAAMVAWGLYVVGPPHWTLQGIGTYFLLLLLLSTFVWGAMGDSAIWIEHHIDASGLRSVLAIAGLRVPTRRIGRDRICAVAVHIRTHGVILSTGPCSLVIFKNNGHKSYLHVGRDPDEARLLRGQVATILRVRELSEKEWWSYWDKAE